MEEKLEFLQEIVDLKNKEIVIEKETLLVYLNYIKLNINTTVLMVR